MQASSAALPSQRCRRRFPGAGRGRADPAIRPARFDFRGERGPAPLERDAARAPRPAARRHAGRWHRALEPVARLHVMAVEERANRHRRPALGLQSSRSDRAAGGDDERLGLDATIVPGHRGMWRVPGQDGSTAAAARGGRGAPLPPAATAASPRIRLCMTCAGCCQSRRALVPLEPGRIGHERSSLRRLGDGASCERRRRSRTSKPAPDPRAALELAAGLVRADRRRQTGEHRAGVERLRRPA